tara:strand:+ start:306 stop:866 length:561 start_codon:yes stop_codon:yes gene_type:complete
MKFLQKRVDLIKKNEKGDLLWLLEHPKTYTAGIRYNKKEVLDKKIKLIKTNRGGKITLHNPGRKIVYFAINLNDKKKDIRNFLNVIETSVINFLSKHKIMGKADKKNIGIWVRNKKISAIGLKVSKWIVYHGCSININNNLNSYKKILPCGLDNEKVTSVYKEIKRIPKNVDKDIINIFRKNISNI